MLVIPPCSNGESPGGAVTWRACVRVSDLVELRIGQAVLTCRSRAPRRGPARGIQTGFRRKLADSHNRARQRYQGISQVRSRQLCLLIKLLSPYQAKAGRQTVTGRRRMRVAPAGMRLAVS